MGTPEKYGHDILRDLPADGELQLLRDMLRLSLPTLRTAAESDATVWSVVRLYEAVLALKGPRPARDETLEAVMEQLLREWEAR